MKRILLLCLMTFVAVGFASGCCHFNVHEPFGPGTGCKSNDCGSCGECGECDSCVAAPIAAPCNDCGQACGSTCGQACADPCQQPCGPLSWLFDVFCGGYCGDGCGEIYWGDFHGDPPDCCEPCDRQGNFTGATSSCGSAAGGSSCCGGDGHTSEMVVGSHTGPRLISTTDRVVVRP